MLLLANAPSAFCQLCVISVAAARVFSKLLTLMPAGNFLVRASESTRAFTASTISGTSVLRACQLAVSCPTCTACSAFLALTVSCIAPMRVISSGAAASTALKSLRAKSALRAATDSSSDLRSSGARLPASSRTAVTAASASATAFCAGSFWPPQAPSTVLNSNSAIQWRREPVVVMSQCLQQLANGARRIAPAQERCERAGELFDGYGLGQIARLIDIGALEDGDVVGQKLQRHRVDDGRDEAIDMGHFDYRRPWLRFQPGLPIGEHVELSAPGTHDLHVRLELVQQVIVRRDYDYRHFLVYQGERPVLEFTSGIRLRMDIGNFLELERAFHGDRPHGTTAKEQRVILLREVFREQAQLAVHFQHLFDGDRGMKQMADEFRLARRREPALSPEHESHEQQ